MFLEKRQRFVRLYEFSFTSRTKLGAPLGLLIDPASPMIPTVESVLRASCDANTAREKQPNGDVVDLVDVKPFGKSLALLFHRGSPDAADPVYRRFAKGKRSLRPSTKDDDEEQAVSAHLVFVPDKIAKDHYRVILEEIPGLSMATIIGVVRLVLGNFKYEYADKKGVAQETYTVVKYTGMKSSTLSDALETGRFMDIRLSKPAEVDFLDAEGLVEAGRQTATVKIKAELDNKTFLSRITDWRKKAEEKGWTDFSVDLELPNNRRKTVKLERNEEAAEVLFVKSEVVTFEFDLAVCSNAIIEGFVTKSLTLAN